MRSRAIPSATLVLCALLAPVAAPAESHEPLLPNLKPAVPAQLSIGLPDDEEQGQRALRFAVSVMNLGRRPLDLLGVLPAEDPNHFVAHQCVTWMQRVCTERRPVGAFVFHEGHNHWHLEDFARYELRRVVDGEPDMSEAGLAAGGDKVSFCLMDSEASEEAGAASWPQFYERCLGVLQGISPGWQDRYDAYLPGQQIIVDGVPDGGYALVVTVDPVGVLVEATKADNVVVLMVELLHGGSEVRLV